MRSGEHFPWEDVNAARENVELQERMPTVDGKKAWLARAQRCPECATPPQHLSWFYFSSPETTWTDLVGRAGWMTICDWCERQVDFFLEVMS